MNTDELTNITSNPDFRATLSMVVANVHSGVLPISKAISLTQSNQKETAAFCFDRLSDPTLSRTEAETLLHLLEPRETAALFAGLMFERDEAAARRVAARINQAAAGVQYQIAAKLQSADTRVVMRALELLEVTEPDRVVLPRLFAVVGRNLPGLTARAALLLQRLDTSSIYTGRLLQHPDARVRAGILQAILESKGAKSLEYLRLCNGDPDNRIRSLAALGLHWQGEPSGIKKLLEMARDPNAAVRWSAVWALGICRCAEAALLVRWLKENDPDERVREQATLAMSRMQRGARSHAGAGPAESEREMFLDPTDAGFAGNAAELTPEVKKGWSATTRKRRVAG
jgi:HEAT repeat protein